MTIFVDFLEPIFLSRTFIFFNLSQIYCMKSNVKSKVIRIQKKSSRYEIRQETSNSSFGIEAKLTLKFDLGSLNLKKVIKCINFAKYNMFSRFDQKMLFLGLKMVKFSWNMTLPNSKVEFFHNCRIRPI